MNYQRDVVRRRLEWIEKAREGILAAVGDDVIDPTFKALPTSDPLKFFLEASLKRPLSKNTRTPLRQYIRIWAKMYDCEVPIINISDSGIKAEVYTKGRHFHGHV
jgi:hypothetical protein